MYAMSVSPLSREVLDRIRPGIFSEYRKSGEAKPERPKRARDFTNNIKIAGEVFEIDTFKGRKTVSLQWERLEKIIEKIPSETVYRGLKGKIIVNNHFNLLAGEKLELILALAPTLDVQNAFTRKWPRKENLKSKEKLSVLLDHLDSLARPVKWKKNSKDLGFLGLFTDGVGNYWFRASRGFHTSLNESLSSIETLIDELDEDVEAKKKNIVNQCYRRLSEYLG
jgi:hypothetical protein